MQINLFPTPAGNSVPLGLTGPEREGVRVILPNAPSRDNDLVMLTCCGCREDEMACHSRGVQSCLSLVGVQNGVYRRVEGIPSCFGVEFLSKRALEGKTSGNLVEALENADKQKILHKSGLGQHLVLSPLRVWF